MTKPRHPEKVNKPYNPIKKKPDWIRSKILDTQTFLKLRLSSTKIIFIQFAKKQIAQNTECWSKKHATFMIMGDTCTRGCAFCDVKTGKPGQLDPFEPLKIAKAVKELNLNHVVITSVDRDDLKDGGANHFKNVVLETKKNNPKTTIEVLTPDFLRKGDSFKRVLESNPDVFNHNIETVPSLYVKVRPGSRYFASIKLLDSVKKNKPNIFTKSGIMVGLGENKNEIIQVMDDLRAASRFFNNWSILTAFSKHHPLQRYYHPNEFKELKDIASSKGFLLVASSPLTRSSYHADEDFKKLKFKSR